MGPPRARARGTMQIRSQARKERKEKAKNQSIKRRQTRTRVAKLVGKATKQILHNKRRIVSAKAYRPKNGSSRPRVLGECGQEVSAVSTPGTHVRTSRSGGTNTSLETGERSSLCLQASPVSFLASARTPHCSCCSCGSCSAVAGPHEGRLPGGLGVVR